MSTPVGEQPTWDGAGTRGVPGRTRRAHDDDRPGAEPVTVEQLLARQGSATGRRRAARRVEEPRVASRVPSRGRARGPRRPPARARGAAGPSPRRRPAFRPSPARRGDHPAARAAARPRPTGARATRRSGSRTVRPSRRSGPDPAPARALPAAGGRRRAAPEGAAPPPRAAARESRPAPAGPRSWLALAVVVGVVVLYHLGLYFYVDQKIGRVEALATDGPEVLAPALQAGAETYLVVGTGVPGQDGGSSVTTLLASVSADRDRAVLVSFPPTALVDTPECRTQDGSLRNPTTEAFAASLLEGGPSCMVRAVQQLSGLRIDHYLGVDLARLPGMVDALGGVPVCITPSEATSAAAMPLQAGPAELSGTTAAGYLEPGDTGADVTGAAVAERAQRLLTSTLRAAMSTGTLTDPVALATLPQPCRRRPDRRRADHPRRPAGPGRFAG